MSQTVEPISLSDYLFAFQFVLFSVLIFLILNDRRELVGVINKSRHERDSFRRLRHSLGHQLANLQQDTSTPQQQSQPAQPPAPFPSQNIIFKPVLINWRGNDSSVPRDADSGRASDDTSLTPTQQSVWDAARSEQAPTSPQSEETLDEKPWVYAQYGNGHQDDGDRTKPPVAIKQGRGGYNGIARNPEDLQSTYRIPGRHERYFRDDDAVEIFPYYASQPLTPTPSKVEDTRPVTEDGYEIIFDRDAPLSSPSVAAIIENGQRAGHQRSLQPTAEDIAVEEDHLDEAHSNPEMLLAEEVANIREEVLGGSRPAIFVSQSQQDSSGGDHDDTECFAELREEKNMKKRPVQNNSDFDRPASSRQYVTARPSEVQRDSLHNDHKEVPSFVAYDYSPTERVTHLPRSSSFPPLAWPRNTIRADRSWIRSEATQQMPTEAEERVQQRTLRKYWVDSSPTTLYYSEVYSPNPSSYFLQHVTEANGGDHQFIGDAFDILHRRPRQRHHFRRLGLLPIHTPRTYSIIPHLRRQATEDVEGSEGVQVGPAHLPHHS